MYTKLLSYLRTDYSMVIFPATNNHPRLGFIRRFKDDKNSLFLSSLKSESKMDLSILDSEHVAGDSCDLIVISVE